MLIVAVTATAATTTTLANCRERFLYEDPPEVRKVRISPNFTLRIALKKMDFCHSLLGNYYIVKSLM